MRAFWAREQGRNSNRRRFTALAPSEISSAIYCYGADEACRGWRHWKGRQQKNVTLLDVLAGGGDKEDAREMELGKSALRENISPLGGTENGKCTLLCSLGTMRIRIYKLIRYHTIKCNAIYFSVPFREIYLSREICLTLQLRHKFLYNL